MQTVPTPASPGNLSPSAAAAVAAIRLFGWPLTRNTAAVLLSMWSRRGELTPRDRQAVLDVFGPAPAVPDHSGCQIGTRWAR